MSANTAQKQRQLQWMFALVLAVFGALIATACVEDPPPSTEPITITTRALPDVWITEPGHDYVAQLIAVSDTPVTWSAPLYGEPNGLPQGLTLNATTGVITGIPTAGASGHVHVTASNSEYTASRLIELRVLIDQSVIVSDPHNTARDNYFVNTPDHGYVSVAISDTGQHFQAGPNGFVAGIGFLSQSGEPTGIPSTAVPVAGDWQALGFSPNFDRIATFNTDFSALLIVDPRDRSTTTEIAHLNIDPTGGSGATEITMPVWSPDGRYIAVSGSLYNQNRHVTTIFDSQADYVAVRTIDHSFHGGFQWVNNDEFIVGSMPRMAEVYSGLPATTVPSRGRMSDPSYEVPLPHAAGFMPVAVSPNGRIAFFGYEIEQPGTSVSVKLITTAADGTDRRDVMHGSISIVSGQLLPIFISTGDVPLGILGNSLQRQHMVHFSPDGTKIATSVGGMIAPIAGALSQQFAVAAIVEDVHGATVMPLTARREYPVGVQGERGYTKDWVYNWGVDLQPYYVAQP